MEENERLTLAIGDSPVEEAVWFSEGLRFLCTGCGNCCTGAAGSVFLSPSDLERLARFFDITEPEFVARYTLNADGLLALQDREGSTDCVFLDENRACTVYEARPTQCRAYPWWLANVQDRESWAQAATECEGIDHPDAPLVPASLILEQARLDAENEANLSPG